jgi:lipopolysaccharide export system protein LptC
MVTERLVAPEEPFGDLTALARPAVAAPAVQGSWRVRTLDRVSSYLPVLLMALLAAFTWWLVRNAPTLDKEGRPTAPPQTPDYTMRGFVLTTYGPDGALRSQLEGDVLQHFAATDTVEVQRPRMRTFDSDGRVMRASSKRAISNGDGSEVQLLGDAVVIREPGTGETPADRVEIRGEFLEIFSKEERVRSHLPVSIVSGRGEVHGGTLDYRHADGLTDLGGRVTGQLRPGSASP